MSANNKVEVKKSTIDGAGRGLFACQDFGPGDLVVLLDRPLLAELDTDRMEDTCDWCFQRGATDPMERMQAASMGLPNGLIEIKKCARCRRVGYCSKNCQNKAWKREHKYECHVLAPSTRPNLPMGVRAVIKLLGRLRGNTGNEREQILDILNFWPAARDSNQLKDIRRLDREKFDDFYMLANAAWTYAGKPSIDGFDVEAVARDLIFNVMYNTFQVGSPLDAGDYGRGFDPLVCSANHSCDPNVIRVSNQPSTILRALKPIKKGEEIFMAYTEVTNPFWVRQAHIKEAYYFTCQCAKCVKCPVSPEDTFAKPPQELSEEYRKVADGLVKYHRAELGKFLAGTDESRAQLRLAAMQASVFDVSESGYSSEKDLKEALHLCIDSGMWTWTRQPVPELCRRLFSVYMGPSRLYKALKLGLKLLVEIMPDISPQPFRPERLILTETLALLTSALAGPMHVQAESELAEYGLGPRVIFWGLMLELRENIPRMYGWDSPFGRFINNYYERAKAREITSEVEIKKEVLEAKPKLQKFLKDIDILKLCDEGEKEGCAVM
ncbi:hypothetical protein F5Y00DRAFT_268455 [Daldinia vernicosa]|uniref:uncharacterized protein n=1 Tax=Daldinia vernicosa TaxID=114800 RepID=UPI002008DE4F|nr:uncharacterized protein F5Y00DRAFT_268455 [Daldinia vernicosa]KAI0850312.1 hypothetical protein F5Y00DRAFT_268455 [Daldinia vernicosa]